MLLPSKFVAHHSAPSKFKISRLWKTIVFLKWSMHSLHVSMKYIADWRHTIHLKQMDSQKNPGNSKVRHCCVSSGGGEEREKTLKTTWALLLFYFYTAEECLTVQGLLAPHEEYLNKGQGRGARTRFTYGEEGIPALSCFHLGPKITSISWGTACLRRFNTKRVAVVNLLRKIYNFWHSCELAVVNTDSDPLHMWHVCASILPFRCWGICFPYDYYKPHLTGVNQSMLTHAWSLYQFTSFVQPQRKHFLEAQLIP